MENDLTVENRGKVFINTVVYRDKKNIFMMKDLRSRILAQGFLNDSVWKLIQIDIQDSRPDTAFGRPAERSPPARPRRPRVPVLYPRPMGEALRQHGKLKKN